MLKKIRTEEEMDKEKRRKQIIIGTILVGMMILSTAGYAILSGDSEKVTKKQYNGFEFKYLNGFWTTEIQGQNFYFSYLPEELENVTVTGVFNIQDYNGKKMYFVNNNPAYAEIIRNLDNYINGYQDACLKGEKCSSSELPVKTCENNLIIFKLGAGNETKVYKDAGCVFISGEVEKRGRCIFI